MQLGILQTLFDYHSKERRGGWADTGQSCMMVKLLSAYAVGHFNYEPTQFKKSFVKSCLLAGHLRNARLLQALEILRNPPKKVNRFVSVTKVGQELDTVEVTLSTWEYPPFPVGWADSSSGRWHIIPVLWSCPGSIPPVLCSVTNHSVGSLKCIGVC